MLFIDDPEFFLFDLFPGEQLNDLHSGGKFFPAQMNSGLKPQPEPR